MESMIWLGIGLMIAGFVLVGIEMILPGFSLPGVSGIICLVVSIFLTSNTIKQGIVLTLFILLMLAIMLGIMIRFLSKGKISKILVLRDEQQADKGYISAARMDAFLGKTGISTTDLRPSGRGEFEGMTLDIISAGEYILKGTPIVVQSVEGSKLIVKEDKK